jgi:hypothetical protein
MASPIIYAGQDLAAGQGQGQLSQYYGYADTSPTTVVSASLVALSTPYVIPAGEAGYAGAAYEMSCAGFGVWGSTQQALTFQTFLGTGFGSAPTVGSVALAASAAFAYSLTMRLTCTDGVSQWWADLLGAVVEDTANLNPGTAGTNAIPIAGVNSGAHTAAVSGALTAAVYAKWNSATGAPTITNAKTTWRKVA